MCHAASVSQLARSLVSSELLGLSALSSFGIRGRGRSDCRGTNSSTGPIGLIAGSRESGTSGTPITGEKGDMRQTFVSGLIVHLEMSFVLNI